MDEPHQLRDNMSNAINYLVKLNKFLGGDVNRCISFCNDSVKKFDKSKSQEDFFEINFWYRCLIRAFFAHVDGITYAMRQIAIGAYERDEVKFCVEEIVILKEENYSMKGNKVASQKKFNNFIDNVKLTFLLFPKVFSVEFELKISDHRWDSFKKSLKARDLITHPKNIDEFHIAPGTINNIQEAIRWFGENIKEMAGKCMESPKYTSKNRKWYGGGRP